MADVDTGGGGGGRKKGGPKTKKKSTKIDMTAMVDVAFLLLTFFVLTATMSSEAVMELAMPPKAKDDVDKEEQYKKIAEDKIMTIILDDDDQIKYYIGITEPDVQETDFSEKGIRRALLGHLYKPGVPRCDEVDNAKGCWDPIFVIKAKKEANYKNLVDLLDEMVITQAPKYAIDKFTPQDSILLEQAAEDAEGDGGEEG